MADRPTIRFHEIEGTMSLDGLTVRATLVGDKLTISIDDPQAIVDSLTMIDERAAETVLHRTGVAGRSRIRATVKQMSDQLHDTGRAAALHVISRMRPDGDIDSEAVLALSRAVALSGRAEMWSWTMSRVRDTFGRVNRQEPDAIIPPFLAAAFADLVGSHGFTHEHYEAMTSSWRTAVGPLPGEAAESPQELPKAG